jgi:hypothetical protein
MSAGRGESARLTRALRAGAPLSGGAAQKPMIMP